MAKPSYSDKVKKLRQLGKALPDKYNLQKQLTPAQKSAVTRMFDKHAYLLNHPDEFSVKSLSKSKANILTVAAAKFKTGKKIKAFIPIEKGQAVTVKKNGQVVFRDRIKEETVFPGGWRTEDAINKAFAKKLRKKEYITARIGGRQPFNRTFDSKAQLMNYLKGFMPTGSLKEKEKERLREIEDMKAEGYEPTKSDKAFIRRIQKKQMETKHDLISSISIVRIYDQNLWGHNVGQKKLEAKKKAAAKNSRH
jgi:hypothetical protein